MTFFEGPLLKIAEMEQTAGLLSVHILLPESIARRLERWTEKMPGASWPAWGGHITLVPNFVPRGTIEEVRATLEANCVHWKPFTVCFAAPMSVKDTTRPDYCAVFLAVEDQGDEQHQPLHELRETLLTALEPLREDVRPELLEKPFLPHVTLALGLGEAEARKLVQAMRAEPLEAEFLVEAIWLVRQTPGEEKRYERHSIPLGGVARAELLRD
jgi:2'-5' RNA ligase